MTQLAQTDRRTTVLMSMLAAAAVSITITVSGLLFVPQIGQSAAPGTNEAAARQARLEQAVQSGLIWQAQREQQSVEALRRQRLLTQAGIEWQQYYELTNPNR